MVLLADSAASQQVAALLADHTKIGSSAFPRESWWRSVYQNAARMVVS